MRLSHALHGRCQGWRVQQHVYEAVQVVKRCFVTLLCEIRAWVDHRIELLFDPANGTLVDSECECV